MAGPRIVHATQPFASLDHRWAWAVGAPYHVAHGDPVDGVADGAPTERSAMLERDWGITGRDDLIEALVSLGDEGHRHRFAVKLQYYSMIWRPAVASMREELRGTVREGGEDAAEAAANLWRLDAVQSDLPGLRSSPLLAFDAARGVMLARDGLRLGWLTDGEVWPYLLAIATDVRRTYSSWGAFGDDFVLSRNVWAGNGAPDLFDQIVVALKSTGSSPWRTLDWPVADAIPPARLVQAAPYWSLERR